MKAYLAAMILCNFAYNYPADFEYCYPSDTTGFDCKFFEKSSQGTPNLEGFNQSFFAVQSVEVVGQIIVLLYLKYRNQLFGKRYLKDGESLLPMVFAFLGCSFLRLMPTCLYSDYANALSMINNTISVIHTANLAYYEDFFTFKTFMVEPEKKINRIEKGMECGFCWKSIKKLKLDEIIKPCKTEDHIFCKECFVNWLTRKHQADENPQYICELCRNPVENTAITFAEEIIAPTFKETTFKLCKSWQGMLVLGLFAINLYSILLCKL